MKRYIKMNKYADGANLGSIYASSGNLAGTLLQPKVNETGFVDYNNKNNYNKSIGASTLQYTGQGAALGSIFGPEGTAIGAGVGALAGATIGTINANKQKKLYNRYLQTQADNSRAMGIMNYQSNIQQGFEPTGDIAQAKTSFKSGGSIHINPKNKGKFNATKARTGKTTEELTHSKNPLTRKRAIFAQNAKKWKHEDGGFINPKRNSLQTGGSQTSFKFGGKIKNRYAMGNASNPDNQFYEVENGEVVEGQGTQLSNGKQLASDMHKVTGYSHEENNPQTGTTGVIGIGGDRVYSDRSYVSPMTINLMKTFGVSIPENSTHAQVAEILARKQGKYEKNIHAVNHRERNTSKIMVNRVKELQDLIFQDQELQKGNLQQFRYGGKLPKNKKGLKRFYDGGEPFTVASKFFATPNEPDYDVNTGKKFYTIAPYQTNQVDFTPQTDNTINYSTPRYGYPIASYETNNPSTGNSVVTVPLDLSNDIKGQQNKAAAYRSAAGIVAPINPANNTPTKPVIESYTEDPVTKRNKYNFNLDDSLGTALNTLNLANNLAGINKMQSYYQPKYPVAPVMNYNKSDTNLGRYSNASIANTMLRGLNRYNPNASNRYAVAASALEANNQITAAENQRRTSFNNQVAQINSGVQNERLNIDNQVNKEKLMNENAKIALRNSAMQAFAVGQIGQDEFKRQLELDRYRSQLQREGRFADTGEIVELANMNKEQLEEAYKSGKYNKSRVENYYKSKYNDDITKKAFGGRVRRGKTISVFD